MDLMKKLRSASVRSVMVTVIILLIAAAGVFFLFQCQNVFATLSPKHLEDLDPTNPESLEGVYVEADIEYIYAQYIEEEQYRDGRATGKITGGEYIVDFDDTYYIGMFLHGGDMDQVDDWVDAAEAWQEGDDIPSFHVAGTIRAMDSQETQYYHSSADSVETQEIMLPYLIDVNRLGGTSIIEASPVWAVWAALAVSVALLLGAVIPLIKALSGAYQKPLLKRLGEMGEESAMLEKLEAFYNGTAPIGGVRLGSEFVMFTSASRQILLRPWEVAWAYQKTTQHRRNGVNTGKTFAAILRTMGGKEYELSMTENEVQQLMEAIHENLPGTVLGYTKEVEDLYKKDRDSFRTRWEEAVPGCTGKN